MAEERREAKPTPRVLLMEFEVSPEAARSFLPEEVFQALTDQTGDGNLPDPLTLAIPVARAAGGPKAVIEREAKTRGRFRAVPVDSWEQGHEAVPPEQQRFELRPL